MLKKSFLTLLPRGSFFRKVGIRIQGLVSGICWQFQQVKNYYKTMSQQGSIETTEHLEALAEDYGLETRLLSESEIKELLTFLRNMPMAPTRDSFFETLFRFFPRIDCYISPTSIFDYEHSQVNVFVTGASQLSGNFKKYLPRNDCVYIAGTVKNLFEKRKLTWFLERYDRAKHKHIISVTVEEAYASAMCNVNEVGILILGSYHRGRV